MSKEDWLKDCKVFVCDTAGKHSDILIAKAKGRGNSTWEYPKKSYTLKLEKKEEMLGLPKHKNWVLLANYLDRTLLRNDVAFQVAKCTGLDWTPSGKFAELYVNDKHLGNYYFCEQIQVGKNRVNITEMKSEDIDENSITGGYLVELDNNYDEVNKFKSSIKSLPYMFKSPDDDVIKSEQFLYFQNYVNQLEAALYSDNWLETRDYCKYIDIESFVDWWLVYEIAKNHEPNHPRSSYMHKDRNGLLKMGPVWDFDYGGWYGDGWWIKDAIYFDRLFQDPEFVKLVKSKWSEYKPRFDEIPQYIYHQSVKIKKSNDTNIKMWPILYNNNGDAELSFKEAIERLSDVYAKRIEWLDVEINKLN